MIWPTDYPVGGRWSNKEVELNSIKACDTWRYKHIHTYTDMYMHIRTVTSTSTDICWEKWIQTYMNIYELYRQYEQIQTEIFVHMQCYICAYFLLYSFIYVHIAHLCAYFLQQNPLVVPYRHVWACMHIYKKNMHIYAQIYTKYMQDTCKIQELQ